MDLVEKLQIKPNMQGMIMHQPLARDAVLEAVSAQCVAAGARAGELDFLVVFLRCKADVSDFAEELPELLENMGEDPMLWLCYPKKSSAEYQDLSRDSGWEPVRHAGFKRVRQIAIGSVWSALRFRQWV